MQNVPCNFPVYYLKKLRFGLELQCWYHLIGLGEPNKNMHIPRLHYFLAVGQFVTPKSFIQFFYLHQSKLHIKDK